MIELGASMDPTTDDKQRRDAFSRADEQLAHAYAQIKSADEQIAQMEAQLSRQRETPRPPLRSRNRPWLRGILGLLFAGYIVAAALVSQTSYGDALAQSGSLPRGGVRTTLRSVGPTDAQPIGASSRTRWSTGVG